MDTLVSAIVYVNSWTQSMLTDMKGYEEEIISFM